MRAIKGIKTTVEGDTLKIEVDLTGDYGPSSSGKTTIVASSEGNVKVDGHEDIKLGLNVFKKN